MLNNPFFKDLPAEQYELLSGLFEPIAVPPRTTIFKQGDAATHLYVILRGRIAVRYKPYDGPRITLTDLHPGDIVGWSSVLGHDAYTSDAISATRVEMLRLRGAELRSLCAQYPAAGKGILEKLAKAVAPRWGNAREQIQQVLKESVRSTA